MLKGCVLSTETFYNYEDTVNYLELRNFNYYLTLAMSCGSFNTFSHST